MKKTKETNTVNSDKSNLKGPCRGCIAEFDPFVKGKHMCKGCKRNTMDHYRKS